MDCPVCLEAEEEVGWRGPEGVGVDMLTAVADYFDIAGTALDIICADRSIEK